MSAAAIRKIRSGLSAITLKWMVGKAEAAGLIFDPVMKARGAAGAEHAEICRSESGSPKNESLTGLWWIVEYLPKRYKDPANNFAPSWMLHRGRPRHVNAAAKVHKSVFDRKRLVVGYAPPNLPADAVEVQ